MQRPLRFKTAFLHCQALLLLAVASLNVTECSATETSADLLIVGATESGWAAAIQAARGGVESIVIVHDGKWYGGQFTEQALACVDEDKGVGKVGWGVDWHPMKRSFHRSGLFKELMDRIEAFNSRKYGSPMPGKPYHGPSTFRPAEAEAFFREMIGPYVQSGQIRLFWNRYPVAAEVEDSTLQGVRFTSLDEGGDELVVRAKLTIDASDWGEVIQVAGAAFECGPDPQSRYGEPSAPVDLSENPANEMNPITWAMIVAESDDETPIEKPKRFDDRNYPRATHLSLNEFRRLRWDNPNPGLGAILHWPPDGKASSRQLSVYSVRRIVDGYSSKDGKTSILLNYMNGQDYPLERLPEVVTKQLEALETGAATKNIVLMTREQRQVVFDNAKQHSLGVLYHLQNFVHDRASDKANSFRRFHLSREFGTPDHLPPKPYIRESLRLKAMYMMREQDGRNRDGETKVSARERFAHVMYPDGLFAWQFHYDFHRTGRTYLKDEGTAGPWIDYHKPNRHTKFLSDRCVFPMRSLIPEKMDGLIGAQANIGVSSIVSAAIRLHDQRIHIGQAAGATAAIAIRSGVAPREMPWNREFLEAVRHELCHDAADAVPLLIWPLRDLDPSHEAFVAINRLASLGLLPIGSREVDFKPDNPASAQWINQVAAKSESDITFETKGLTRGQVCQKLWEAAEHDAPTEMAFRRLSGADADNDGIMDQDDALPFIPNEPIVFSIEAPDVGPQEDGLPDPSLLTTGAKFRRMINFCGTGVKSIDGVHADHGSRFDDQRGYGWHRDLSANHRNRGRVKGMHDSFIFTRQKDKWECDVPNGKYQIAICIGDSGHAQPGQNVSVEGHVLANDVSTFEGTFMELSKEMEVRDGKLTVEIGKVDASTNTTINWISIRSIDVN